MKALLALSIAAALICVTGASASPPPSTYTYLGWQVVSYRADTAGYHLITDTLGGDGRHAPSGPRYTLTTDTLGGDGSRAALAPPAEYTFIADTLAPGGTHPGDLSPVDSGFSWTDAGVGAGTGIAVVALMSLTTLLLRRIARLA